VPLLTQALEQTTARETVAFPALCRLPLGEAQLLAGHLEEAHALAEQALVLAREHQERSNEAHALRLLGDIATRRDPPEAEEAEAYYRQARALAEELGMRPLVAHRVVSSHGHDLLAAPSRGRAGEGSNMRMST
jgi:ATP/maltotriose-dependent transcriptional regulator MalT